RVLEERSRQLILPPTEQPPAEPLREDVAEVSKEPRPPVPPRVTQSQLRRQRRLERNQQVMTLFNSGQSQAAISRALGMGRKTMRGGLGRGEFRDRSPRTVLHRK